MILPVKWNASVVGHFFVLWRLNWATDSLDYWDEIFMKVTPEQYRSLDWVQHATTRPRQPLHYFAKYTTFWGMQVSLIGGGNWIFFLPGWHPAAFQGHTESHRHLENISTAASMYVCICVIYDGSILELEGWHCNWSGLIFNSWYV